MATGAHTVANRFLELAREKGMSLTPLQLMKLVYIAHGWMLGLQRRPLITNKIEAWKFGPVIPDLYREVRNYGAAPITAPIRPWHAENQPIDPIEDDMIRQTFNVYGHLDGLNLSALTHQIGTPWANTWRADSWAAEIPNHLIEDHYRQLAHVRSSARS